jgi:hypothetical protein
MKIVGGNLRLVFGDKTFQDLIAFIQEALSHLDVSHFGAQLHNYFTDPKEGRLGTLYHRLFACYSISPFDQVHEISYVSPWVESEANSRLLSLRSEGDAAMIIHAQNWLAGVFGLNFLAGSVHGCLFEALCHARITRRSRFQSRGIDLGEHHFEFVDWSPGVGLDPRKCWISQVAIPKVRPFQGDVSEIPRAAPKTRPWYWNPTQPNFPGVDALYFDGSVLYVLRMTVGDKHDPVSLDSVREQLLAWRNLGGLALVFVTLVDTRDRQRIYLAKQAGMIVKGDPFRKIPKKVGVLCTGAVEESATRTNLADFFLQLLKDDWQEVPQLKNYGLAT